MKRRATPSKRTRRQSAPGVSLFPFLAVLICTMGALILLLVVIAQRARVEAAEDTAGIARARAKLRSDLAAAREWTELEIDEFHNARKRTADQLVEARLTLGHIEDHARQLREELARLEATWAELEALEAGGGRRRESVLAEIDRLKREMNQAERDLTRARAAAQEHSGTFAVVPYEGPNGTDRRPIYIECRENGVVIQPEGIAFGAEDFSGPLGAGNPLDVALRAIREHLLRKSAIGDAGEPYPLLLIRPAGIEAYYAARAAMKSWASEFGYELIGEDWEIAYEAPDPELIGEVARAVEIARARQQRLVAAAPRSYASHGPSSFVVSPGGGGLVPVVDGVDGSEEFQRPGTRFAPATDRSEGISSELRNPAEHLGERPGYSASHRFPRVGSRYEGSAPPGQTASTGAGSGALGVSPESPSNTSDDMPYGASSGTSSHAYPDASSHTLAGEPAGRSGNETANVSAGAGSLATEESPSGSASGGAADSGCGPTSLAEVRGRNWGLPASMHGSVPITAPVRIDCHANRLVLVPEQGLGEPHEIPLEGRTADSIDPLVGRIWEYVELWGTAGRRMSWRPIISVHVAPNAEQRFADMAALLEGSGLEVERYEP